jgi:hypothetical protein
MISVLLPGTASQKNNGGASKKFVVKFIAAFAFLFLAFQFNLQAQGPAANITGPLKAWLKGGRISLVSHIATSSATPTIKYTITQNTSGANLVSTGQFVYNSATGEGTQTIVVNPGIQKGSFNIQLNVTDANGSCESSKSVTVTSNK